MRIQIRNILILILISIISFSFGFTNKKVNREEKSERKSSNYGRWRKLRRLNQVKEKDHLNKLLSNPYLQGYKKAKKEKGVMGIVWECLNFIYVLNKHWIKNKKQEKSKRKNGKKDTAKGHPINCIKYKSNSPHINPSKSSRWF